MTLSRWPQNIISVFKLSLIFTLGVANLGNEGCEEEDSGVSERILRKRASVSRVTTNGPMELPGGGQFDFGYLANAQLYDVITAHDRFILSQGSSGSNSSGVQNMSAEDYSTLRSWGAEHNVDVLGISDSSPSCVRSLPMVDISGNIESFEIVGGGGISFGFGSNVGPNPIAIGLKFQMESAQLALNFQGYHPLNAKTSIATGRVPANQTKTKIDLGVDVGLFKVGLNWFYETPLANVSHKAMSLSLEAMANQYDEKRRSARQPIWETSLREDHDAFVTIYAGAFDGLQVGDEIEIHNLVHYWEGEPCNSVWSGSGRTNSRGEPNGIYRIVDTLDFISRAEPLVQSEDRLLPGAQVVIHRFAGEFEEDEVSVSPK